MWNIKLYLANIYTIYFYALVLHYHNLRFGSLVNLQNIQKYYITERMEALTEGSNKGFIDTYRKSMPSKGSSLLLFDIHTWKEAKMNLSKSFNHYRNSLSLRKVIFTDLCIFTYR